MELAVREAKARLSELIAAAEKGERVVITRHGVPAVELVRLPPPRGASTSTSWRRPAGGSASKEMVSGGRTSSTIRHSAGVCSVSNRRTDKRSCVFCSTRPTSRHVPADHDGSCLQEAGCRHPASRPVRRAAARAGPGRGLEATHRGSSPGWTSAGDYTVVREAGRSDDATRSGIVQRAVVPRDGRRRAGPARQQPQGVVAVAGSVSPIPTRLTMRAGSLRSRAARIPRRRSR